MFFSFFKNSSHGQEKLKFSYCQGLSSQRFLGETIGQRLDQTVEKFPDREAYVFCEDNQRATFAELQKEVICHSFICLNMYHLINNLDLWPFWTTGLNSSWGEAKWAIKWPMDLEGQWPLRAKCNLKKYLFENKTKESSTQRIWLLKDCYK